MKLISKHAAQSAGLKRYYTGESCRDGHTSERLVSTGQCVECHREKNRAYHQMKRETRLEYLRQWRNDNRDNIREYDNARNSTPKQKAKNRAYSTLHNCLAAEGTGNAYKATKVLGYTPDELRAHIERQFDDGMGWHNRSEWHIDHITPVSWFIENGIRSPRKINCLSNLKPVWASENISKSAKRTHLL